MGNKSVCQQLIEMYSTVFKFRKDFDAKFKKAIEQENLDDLCEKTKEISKIIELMTLKIHDPHNVQLRQEIAQHFREDFVGEIIEGVAIAKDRNFGRNQGKYYINVEKMEIIPGRYFDTPKDDLPNFSEGYAAVKKSVHSWPVVGWFIDKDGNEYKPKQDFYEDVYNFQEGYARVKDQGQWYFLDKNMKPWPTKEHKFEEAMDFSQGKAAVKQNGKWFYICKDGSVFPPRKTYKRAQSFSEGLGAVQNKCVLHTKMKNGKRVNITGDRWFFINHTTTRHPLTEMIFNNVNPFSNGWARVRKGMNDKYIFINKYGKILREELDFDLAHDFKNGFARVSLENKWVWINNKGKLIGASHNFSEVTDFSCGYAMGFQIGNGRVLVDEDGLIVSQLADGRKIEGVVMGFEDKVAQVIVRLPDGSKTEIFINNKLKQVFNLPYKNDKYGHSS